MTFRPRKRYYVTMKFAIPLLCFMVAFSACSKNDEMSLEELEALNAEGLQELLAKTQT